MFNRRSIGRILLIGYLVLQFSVGCSAQIKPPTNIVEIKTMDDWQVYLLGKQPSDFLYFFSTQCPWCEKQSPEIVQLAQKYQKVKFIKVNVNILKEVAREYKVRSYPTTMFNGQRFVGYTPFDSLSVQIDNYFENLNRFPDDLDR